MYLLVILIFLVAGFLIYKSYYNVDISKQTGQKKDIEKQSDKALFSFVSENISVAFGSDFTLDIAIDPAAHKVSNADLIFSYDKAKLRLDNISQSQQFKQILSSNFSTQGFANYSASTDLGSDISSKTSYATLHFHALEKTDSTLISVDQKKSGIYGDDNPGINDLGASSPANVSIH